MDIDGLIRQTKVNCNISDAKSWGYYSICGLLMRLRELYLHEHSLLPWQNVPMPEVSSWIRDREALWQRLEEEDLKEIVLNGEPSDPFDVNGLNNLLRDSGYLYGSGYGILCKPTFFIAQIDSVKEYLDYCVYYLGREVCRDLAASPAMLQGRCIYLRQDVLKSILWDKFQTLNAKYHRGAVEKLFLHYGIGRNEAVAEDFVRKMDVMVRGIAELFVMHEIGEAFEDEHGDEWFQVLQCCFDKQSELYLRGTKDLLADTSVQGPLFAIVREKNEPLLLAYVAFLEGVTKELFGEMGKAWQQFGESGDWALIEEARVAGHEKAGRFREGIMALWREEGGREEFAPCLGRFIRDTLRA